jgi:hypothetical protein
MQNKIFITHAFFLFYGVATHAYAIDDISLPDRIRQDQRLKELNQQLEDQFTQPSPKPVTTQLQDFKTKEKLINRSLILFGEICE